MDFPGASPAPASKTSTRAHTRGRVKERATLTARRPESAVVDAGRHHVTQLNLRAFQIQSRAPLAVIQQKYKSPLLSAFLGFEPVQFRVSRFLGNFDRLFPTFGGISCCFFVYSSSVQISRNRDSHADCRRGCGRWAAHFSEIAHFMVKLPPLSVSLETGGSRLVVFHWAGSGVRYCDGCYTTTSGRRFTMWTETLWFYVAPAYEKVFANHATCAGCLMS